MIYLLGTFIERRKKFPFWKWKCHFSSYPEIDNKRITVLFLNSLVFHFLGFSKKVMSKKIFKTFNFTSFWWFFDKSTIFWFLLKCGANLNQYFVKYSNFFGAKILSLFWSKFWEFSDPERVRSKFPRRITSIIPYPINMHLKLIWLTRRLNTLIFWF